MRFFLFLLILITAACNFYPEAPPVMILKAAVYRESCLNFSQIGFRMGIMNTGSRKITGMRISFYLYDTDGNPFPSPYSNFITAEFNQTVNTGQSIDLAVSLDKCFTVLPEFDPEIDNLKIVNLHFADGSSWERESGFYFQGGFNDIL